MTSWAREPVAAAADVPGAGSPALFATDAWGHVLEGLGCRAERIRNVAAAQDVVVPVFRRGPLRIGFLGFPLAGGAFDAMPAAEFARHAGELAAMLRLDIVRGSRGGLAGPGPGPSLPESWIGDLAAWPGAMPKKLARDLAYARRSSPGVVLAARADDPAQWHALYAKTVGAHGGKLRYTEEYFRRLAATAAADAGLHAVDAIGPDGRHLGFAILAMHRGTGYYLHGGATPEAKKSGISDLLLWDLIGHAKERGMHRFSLMASPANQEGLVRFKRKWGDTHGYAVTDDLGHGVLGRSALAARDVAAAFGRRISPLFSPR